MAAIDFPASPSNGQQFTGPGGVLWVYDSTKTAWVSGTLTTGIYAPITNDVGRNRLHNSMFTITQRGTAAVIASGGYPADRWVTSAALDAISFQQVVMGDGGRVQTGDEASRTYLTNNFTAVNNTASYNYVYQRIEDVYRLAGKTVTVSFYARASTNGLKLGVSIDQNFGTGTNSPSGVVPGAGQSATLTLTFARYSLTFTIPSVSGKTPGNNNDNATQLNLWFSSGATAAPASGIGLQSGVIDIWGVQLEPGTVATPLEKRDPVYELQQCQRFYCAWATSMLGLDGWSGAGGQGISAMVAFPVAMRTSTPAVVVGNNTNTNFASVSAQSISATSFRLVGATNGVGSAAWTGNATVSADL